MSEDLIKRLRASVRMRAYDGDEMERAVCARQMSEAANEIERLRNENAALQRDAREIDMQRLAEDILDQEQTK